DHVEGRAYAPAQVRPRTPSVHVETSVHDDAARDLARLHRPEGVIQLLERDTTGYERVEIEPAELLEPDDLREVAGGIGRAVDASTQCLGADHEIHRAELHHV